MSSSSCRFLLPFLFLAFFFANVTPHSTPSRSRTHDVSHDDSSPSHRFHIEVFGQPTYFRGTTNTGPLTRMFYTAGHAWLHTPHLDAYLTIDSGSRWPWLYVDGVNKCFPESNVSAQTAGDTGRRRYREDGLRKFRHDRTITSSSGTNDVDLCPNVPRYNVTASDTGVQLNSSSVSFSYGAGVFSSNASVGDGNGGFFFDELDIMSGENETVPLKIVFAGVNQVAVNNAVLETLASGILGIGPPCFAANDTDAPCEPFFLGQAQRSLGFSSQLVEYSLVPGSNSNTTSGSSRSSRSRSSSSSSSRDSRGIPAPAAPPYPPSVSSSLGSGILSLGALLSPNNTYAWQPLNAFGFSEGLYWIDLQYAITAPSNNTTTTSTTTTAAMNSHHDYPRPIVSNSFSSSSPPELEFLNCSLALVDTGGGPIELPGQAGHYANRTWSFPRNCSGDYLGGLPTFTLRLPARPDVLFELAPADYVFRFYNETSQQDQCESGVLSVQSVGDGDEDYDDDNDGGDDHDDDDDDAFSLCVVGMWIARKYPLVFRWTTGQEAVAFGGITWNTTVK